MESLLDSNDLPRIISILTDQRFGVHESLELANFQMQRLGINVHGGGGTTGLLRRGWALFCQGCQGGQTSVKKVPFEEHFLDASSSEPHETF